MNIFNKLNKYHFELRHLVILFITLILFQTILSYIHSVSTSRLLTKNMETYRQDVAERIADLTTTSLELLLRQSLMSPPKSETEIREVIHAFNIILSQQTLQDNVEDMCILVSDDENIYAINNGTELYDIFFDHVTPRQNNNSSHNTAVEWYSTVREQIMTTEHIFTSLENGYGIFDVLVPFVPKGEYEGVVYMKITPDFHDLVKEISRSYNQIGALFTALILFGLLAMFIMTSYTVNERDVAQHQLFEERTNLMVQQIELEKEDSFTKRIYHAHHKVEKIMGFIKEDTKSMTQDNLALVQSKVIKYANYVARVIYGMKSSDPPIEVIRGDLFQTDINSVLQFVTDNLFNRVYARDKRYTIVLDLDETMPLVSVNEYVFWEIIDPLISNCFEHNHDRSITISIKTKHDTDINTSFVYIQDDGVGIDPNLLHEVDGKKSIFNEKTSTKTGLDTTGYGCYIAYETSRKCGWGLDVENIDGGGTCLILTICHDDKRAQINGE
ncbi:MAG: HAMP domain-containing histidine kinase [Candidatus Marinimicrobia bacterium]|nr:HAMP domain-containing histidine kinase [Candidatus Neomarinimicrobiota bacterium]